MAEIIDLPSRYDKYDRVSTTVFECGCGGQLFVLHESGHVVCVRCQYSMSRLKVIDEKRPAPPPA